MDTARQRSRAIRLRHRAVMIALALGMGPLVSVPAHAAEGDYVFEKAWDVTGSVTGVTDVVVGADGSIFVTSSSETAELRRYDNQGSLLSSMDLSFKPGDAAVDQVGNLHLTFDDRDPAPRGVHVYTPEGQPVRSYTPPDTDQFRDVWPSDVAVDPAGNAYVSYSGPLSSTIARFGPDGTYLGSWGVHGSAAGQLTSPQALTNAPDGTVYIADGLDRIQQFTPDGTFIRGWGQSGFEPGQFYNPNDLEFGPNGHLFVSDGNGVMHSDGRVQEFTPDGQFVRAFGQEHLWMNAGLAIDKNSVVYVAGRLSTEAHQWRGVAKFVPAPATPPTPPTRQVGKLKVSKKPMKVRKRTLRLSVVCPRRATGGCRGVARVRVGTKVITTKRRYAVQAGETAKVKLRVTKKRMRKIKRKPTKAVAELSAPGARKPIVRKRIRIRR